MIQYVKDNDGKASINTSDWGATQSDLFQITFELYEVDDENLSNPQLLGSNSHGFANGIQVITAIHDSSYEVVRSVVDYTNDTFTDKTYYGQITERSGC